MKQTARELTICEDRFLNGKRYLIMDRDSKFSDAFRAFLDNEGVTPVRLPPRSPNLNAHLERFLGSLKRECLGRLVLFGEKATRKAVNQFLIPYHEERCHQGFENNLIVAMERPPDVDANLETTERLGGLLRSYRRADLALADYRLFELKAKECIRHPLLRDRWNSVTNSRKWCGNRADLGRESRLTH